MFHQIKKSWSSLRLVKQPSKELVSVSDDESFNDNDKCLFSDNEIEDISKSVSQHEALKILGATGLMSSYIKLDDTNSETTIEKYENSLHKEDVSDSITKDEKENVSAATHDVMNSIQSPRFVSETAFTDKNGQSASSPLPEWESIFARVSGSENISQRILIPSSNNSLDKSNEHANNATSPSYCENIAIHPIQSSDGSSCGNEANTNHRPTDDNSFRLSQSSPDEGSDTDFVASAHTVDKADKLQENINGQHSLQFTRTETHRTTGSPIATNEFLSLGENNSMDENLFSKTRNFMLSVLNCDNQYYVPNIIASQSLPDTTEEMLDPMIASSYRMRVMTPMNNFQESDTISSTGAKSNFGNSMKDLDSYNKQLLFDDNHSVLENDDEKQSDVCSPDSKGNAVISVAPHKWTPSDQNWYSPRQKWLDQRKENLDSPPSILGSSSLPSPNDEVWDAATYRKLIVRRSAGGTPLGVKSKYAKKQKSVRNEQKHEVATEELLSVGTACSKVFNCKRRSDENSVRGLQNESKEEIVDYSWQDDDMSVSFNMETRNAANRSKSCVTKISGIVDAEEDFKWAYEVWTQKGLLQRTQSTNQINPQNVASPIPVLNTQLREGSGSFCEKKEAIESVSRGIGDKVTIIKTHDGRKSWAPMSFSQKLDSGKRSKDGFSTILKQWKTVSDDKPCSHFLSPEFQQSHSSRLLNDNVTKSDSFTLENGKNNTFDDYFQERIKETLLINEKKKSSDVLHGDDILPVESHSHVEGTTTSGNNPQSNSRGVLHRRIVRDLVSPNALDKRMKSKGAGIGDENASDILKRTAPGRHTYRTLCKEFLSDDLNKNRSKSTPRIMRSVENQRITSKPNTPPQLLPQVLATRSTNETNGQGEDQKNARSKSLPRLREDSQMARSLSNLRSKLTKEYTDQDQDEQTKNTSQPRRSSRLVLDLLEQKKTGFHNVSSSFNVPSMVEVSRGGRNVASTKDSQKKMELPTLHRTFDHIGDFEDATISTKSVSTRSLVDSCIKSYEVCRCSSSLFSGDDEMIDFYLPLTGTACVCGKRASGLRKPDEPTSLANILRPWQVDFLGSYGIFLGDQLVKAHHRSAKELAQALRRYRKKHNMKTFDTKNCSSALKVRFLITFAIIDKIYLRRKLKC